MPDRFKKLSIDSRTALIYSRIALIASAFAVFVSTAAAQEFLPEFQAPTHGPPIVSWETGDEAPVYFAAPASGIESIESGRIRQWLNDIAARIDASRAEAQQRDGLLVRAVNRITKLIDALRTMAYSGMKMLAAFALLVLAFLLVIGVAFARLKKFLTGL